MKTIQLKMGILCIQLNLENDKLTAQRYWFMNKIISLPKMELYVEVELADDCVNWD